ncbi:MAG: hypothetical protein GY816_23490 [Cytophagales bacterium]|nr:hypothetical protein [Cytophagales bacterium]
MKNLTKSSKLMKRIAQCVIGLSVATMFVSCTDQCNETYSYIEYTPQYVNLDEMRLSFDILPPKEINQSGKIYLYGTTLFMTEPDSGIHIIDNSLPESPVKKNFIQLAGVHDIAVKGTTLYADSYMDLVVMDITDINNIEMLKRIEDVFLNEYAYYPEDENFISHYIETDQVQLNELDCDQGNIFWEGDVMFWDSSLELASLSGGGSNTTSGVSGSMARMNIVDDYLYGIDDWALNVFDLSDSECPVEITEVNVGWGIETLFPYKSSLFIGAADGLYIFDNTNPIAPTLMSKFNHARACDPVVVQDDIAYVTLRDGTACDGFANQLDVVDVSDLSSPELLYSFGMDNPHGLGIDGDVLIICEGEYGLKLFDKSDLSQIGSSLKNWIKDINAFDVIPIDNLLILIGEDGLYQFDYSDPDNIKFLSLISTD